MTDYVPKVEREAVRIHRPLDGLGASDAAAILGVSRWRSALDVFNDKMGIAGPDKKQEHQEWGLILEDAIAARYMSETGRRVRKMGLARSKDHPLLYSHPDRLVIGEPGLVEIKTSDHRWEDGEIPIYYKTQAIQQMITANREWVDFAVLVRGQRFLTPIPRLERNRAIEPDFIAELEEWWQRYIVGKEPPEMDGGDGGRQYLRRTFPRAELDEVVATAVMLPTIDRFRIASTNRKQAEEAEEKAKQEVMALIGEAHVISGPFGKVTWTRFPANKVDWKGAFADVARLVSSIEHAGIEDMSGPEAVEWIKSMHTSVVQSNRVTPQWKEENDQ